MLLEQLRRTFCFLSLSLAWRVRVRSATTPYVRFWIAIAMYTSKLSRNIKKHAIPFIHQGFILCRHTKRGGQLVADPVTLCVVAYMGNQPHWTRPCALDGRTVATPKRKDELWPKGAPGKTEPAGNEPKFSHIKTAVGRSRAKAKERTPKGGEGPLLGPSPA